MEFHSYFSDKSRQDAATTTVHMIILINHLFEDGVFGKSGTMLDDTDGCAKQYRCATAIHLLSMLSVKYGITIDRQVGAPGHGKDIIDGVNAVNKNYISKCFCMTKRICSLDERISGVKGDVKHSKPETNTKITMQRYHVQDPKKVKFTKVKMGLKGLQSKKGVKHNGIVACYNICTDPEVGINQAAVRWIPCACKECFQQLSSPWVNGLNRGIKQAIVLFLPMVAHIFWRE
jgi:hypothetical protein